jgi:hypothetical protein
MNAKRKTLSLIFAGLALASLVLGALAGALVPSARIFVIAGFVGYLLCGGKAMGLWPVRTRQTDRDRSASPRPSPTHRVAAILALALAAPAALSAQQTIFNVPSADVLDPGKVYLEVDELFRPTDPEFSSTTVRGVVGLFSRVEAGVNIGGLYAPGPSVPTATVVVKIQPVRADGFSLTAGGYGLFYFDSNDGDPAGLGYGFASYRIPGLGTRIEFGGWYASAGFVHPPHRVFGSSTGGALATFEQPLPWVKGLTLAADWWSGENAIGYVSPGLIYTFGHWTAYAAYSIKNGDSKGNAGLIELGYAF